MAEEVPDTQKKTLKLKRSAEPEQQEPLEVDNVVMAAMPRGAAKPAGSYVPDVICALIALVLFGALMVVQWLELNYYARPPSAW